MAEPLRRTVAPHATPVGTRLGTSPAGRAARALLAASLLCAAPATAGPLQPGVPAVPPGVTEIRDAAARLAGTYAVEGRNTDGSAYRGQVHVTVSGGTVYFRWEIGRDVYLGEGSLAGDILTIYWGQPDPVVYAVRPDGRLQGTWARGRASEVLTPLR